MKYKTKEWTLKAFCYDPYGEKPDWFLKMVERGEAYEYKDAEKQYVEFGDKRDTHKAFCGDWIVYDVFGRRDVCSAKTFPQRYEAITTTP